MVDNSPLQQAKRQKKDEFYTQLSDIEKELRHYKASFRDKVVYCNCDDPRVSNFFRYFQLKFRSLGLRKLITTCYKNQNPDMFSQHVNERSIGLAITEQDGNSDDLPSIDIFNLDGDGDFRSDECVEMLKQADIVVTNPPFSLFREYIYQLVQYGKKFVIIGNMNAVSYKEIFPLIKDGRIWLGASIKSGDREFGVPENYPLTAATSRIDECGNRFIRVKSVRWFTNLDYAKRHEDLILYRRYSPNEYPKYDNYDAINVNKTSNIPADYAGEMGVPVTFLDKHNPDQFEIMGIDGDFLSNHTGGHSSRFYVDGDRKYARVVIRNRRLNS